MKPVVKYQGGKTKELSLIKQLAPPYKRIIEPFCGGAAVSLNYGDVCVVVMNILSYKIESMRLNITGMMS